VPITDTFAVRASAFTRLDPGYIDNPVLHIDGVNEERVSGGRLAALWQASDTVSLKLSALFQDFKANGSSDTDIATPGYTLPPLGDLQQSYLPSTGGYETKVQAYSATLKAKLGNVDLTAISGYNVASIASLSDFTYAFGLFTQYGTTLTGPLCPTCSTFAGFGVPGTGIPSDITTRKFTQEIRLSAPIGQHFDWLLGAFYTHEALQNEGGLLALAPTGAPAGTWETSNSPATYAEYAGFADLTCHVTDRFDIQLGARESHITVTNDVSTTTGVYVPVFQGQPSPAILPEFESTSNAFTYLVTPRFKLTPDSMIYARLASGYRPGGPNAILGVPRQYGPDKTQNYELGVKSDFLDHTLFLDASVYYIDWNNIQLKVLDAQTFQYYTSNASRAKSQGVELSAESKPWTGLTLAAWVSWNDAELTRAIPPGPALGISGDRLPYGARFSSNFSVRQEFRLSDRLSAFVGGAVSYIGYREGEFQSAAPNSPPRQSYPPYARTDLRAGLSWTSWKLDLFANNIADKRGQLSGGAGYFPPFGYTYIQPRTLGLAIAKTF
jgi:outer membrane receptor protein involved in Fe transport